MFDQAFQNIDLVRSIVAGCTTEVHYAKRTAWPPFLKYVDGLEQDWADDSKTSHDGKRGVDTHGGVNL
jgi:hypothetical protein